MAGLREMIDQAVDLAPLGQRLSKVEDRLDALESQPAADSYGPNNYMTISPEGVVTESEGPEGPEGLEGPEGPEGLEGPEGPEGTQGKEGPQGKEGKTGAAGAEGGAVPFGTVDIYTLPIWPKGAGTALDVFIDLLHRCSCIFYNGYNSGAASGSNATIRKFRGSPVGLGGFQGGGGINRILQGMNGLGLPPLGALDHSYLRLERSVELNGQAATAGWLVGVSTQGLLEQFSASTSKAEAGGVLEVKSTAAPAARSQVIFASIARKTNNPPLTISDIGRSAVAEIAGVEWTVGWQVYFPTIAEKEAGTIHTFKWTFANSGVESAAQAQHYSIIV